MGVSAWQPLERAVGASGARKPRRRPRGLRASFGVVIRFRRELLSHWPKLLAALGFSLAYSAARIAEPWPLKFIFDNVLAGMPLDTHLAVVDDTLGGSRMAILATATMAILVLAALRGVLYARQSILTTDVAQQVVLTFRRRTFARLQRLSLSFHARTGTGDLLTRLTGDVTSLRELMVGSLLTIMSEGIVLVGFLTVMLVMEWRLALVALVAMPLVFVLVSVYSARIRDATRKQRGYEGELASRVQEVLSGIHLVQLFARESDEDERLRRLNKRSLRSGLRTAELEAGLNRSVELAVAVSTAVTLWLGATQVIAGRLTPGELIVFIAYMQSFYRPLKRISKVTRRASKAAVSVERIMEVLEQEPDVRDGSVEAPRLRGEIRFERVEFAYDALKPVLRGIDLDVPAGATLALVGTSGAGKSTLLGLVPRLFDPTAGAVLVDGLDVRTLTLTSLREQIAVVPQDGMLFRTSVLENIAYGKPQASDDEIEAAARAALIHDVVAALPDGYETVLGERGVTLSGGQRQRLAIARALVKDAPIVLLDEPTVGLDAESAELVTAALEGLLVGRTSIVIAHRLDLASRADLVAVLDGGNLVELGSHAELVRSGGVYSKLYELHDARSPKPATWMRTLAPSWE